MMVSKNELLHGRREVQAACLLERCLSGMIEFAQAQMAPETFQIRKGRCMNVRSALPLLVRTEPPFGNV